MALVGSSSESGKLAGHLTYVHTLSLMLLFRIIVLSDSLKMFKPDVANLKNILK